MNAPQDLTPATAQIGALLAGGILAGRFFLGTTPYALIVAPKEQGEFPATVWNKSAKEVKGALSYYDGLANTKAMAEAGSALAVKILGLKLGGFEDWYLMSRGEALLAKAAEIQGDEAFERDLYWTSTQDADVSSYAWSQSFGNGTQDTWLKASKTMARAVRRVTI